EDLYPINNYDSTEWMEFSKRKRIQRKDFNGKTTLKRKPTSTDEVGTAKTNIIVAYLLDSVDENLLVLVPSTVLKSYEFDFHEELRFFVPPPVCTYAGLMKMKSQEKFEITLKFRANSSHVVPKKISRLKSKNKAPKIHQSSKKPRTFTHGEKFDAEKGVSVKFLNSSMIMDRFTGRIVNHKEKSVLVATFKHVFTLAKGSFDVRNFSLGSIVLDCSSIKIVSKKSAKKTNVTKGNDGKIFHQSFFTDY
ncbi:hypothetical protein HK096_004785, partial [Nowakowskiella sp. JEL0078]